MIRLSVIFTGCLLGTIALADKPPNILIMVADDLGWNDVGYHGSDITTPNIDRLAGEGVELDRFYVQPSCSPTRAALMTGKLPMRLGIYRPINKHAEHGVPLSEKLLPQYLADLGYQAFAVGKWHLGHHRRSQLPDQRGFRHFYGSLTGGIGYWNKVHGGGYDWQRNGKTLREDGYVTHLLTQEIESLIEARDAEHPVFLYVAFQAPHTPNEAPAATVARYEGKFPDNPVRHIHAAMVDELDQAVGKILNTFERAGLLSNTLVLFMSDNGGLIPPGPPETRSGVQSLGLLLGEWFDRPIPLDGLEFIASSVYDAGSDNQPLVGGKMQTSEGGVRVPAVLWWPDKLPPGRHLKPITVVDVLPTLLDLAGGGHLLPDNLDGRSQWAALQGGQSETPPYFVSDLSGGITVFDWPWKLVDSDSPQLFNIEQDPYETTNLAASEPDVVARLRALQDRVAFAPDPGFPLSDLLFDPDTFGGEEDGRPPWPDAVIDQEIH